MAAPYIRPIFVEPWLRLTRSGSGLYVGVMAGTSFDLQIVTKESLCLYSGIYLILK